MYSSHNFFNAHFIGNRWVCPFQEVPISIKIDTHKILQAHQTPYKRREKISDWTVTEKGMNTMNSLVAQFNSSYTPLEKDDMVTLARWTTHQSILSQQFIQNKKQIYQYIKWIAGANYWPTHSDTRQVSNELTKYFYFAEQPIPDTIPLVGLIDNALIINEVEHMFVSDIQSIGDFMEYCFAHHSNPHPRLLDGWMNYKQHRQERMRRPETFVADHAATDWIKLG